MSAFHPKNGGSNERHFSRVVIIMIYFFIFRRRIKSHSTLIGNTIAVAILDGTESCEEGRDAVRNIRNLKFFWKSDHSGLPAPVFELLESDRDVCGNENSHVSLWPIAGISVILEQAPSVLVVACSISCGSNTKVIFY